MSFEKSGVDRRESFRCPVSGPGCEAVLKVGETEMPVRLLDESAGGFAVRAERQPPIKANDVVRLGTSGGWAEVRVTNIAEQRPVETEGEPPAETEAEPSDTTAQSTWRVGLQRLRDLQSWEDAPRRRWFFRLPRPTFAPPRSSQLVAGIAITLACVALPVAAVALSWNLELTSITKLIKGLEWSNTAGRHLVPIEPDGRSAGRAHPAAPRPPDSNILPDLMARDSTPLGRDQLQRIIQNSPGAAALMLPEVIRELSLSDVQQEQSRQIVDATEKLLETDAFRLADNPERHSDNRRRLLEEARHLALQTLTPQQQVRWAELQGDNR